MYNGLGNVSRHLVLLVCATTTLHIIDKKLLVTDYDTCCPLNHFHILSRAYIVENEFAIGSR